MGLSPARWLVDKSALYRLPKLEVADAVWRSVHAGVVGVSIVTELEMGFSARSTDEC